MNHAAVVAAVSVDQADVIALRVAALSLLLVEAEVTILPARMIVASATMIDGTATALEARMIETVK